MGKIELKSTRRTALVRFGPRIVPLMRKRAEEIKEACMDECPVGDRAYVDEEGDHPGALRDSHEVVKDGFFNHKIVVNARYGLHVYEGNGPEGPRPPNRWLNRGLDRVSAQHRGR